MAPSQSLPSEGFQSGLGDHQEYSCHKKQNKTIRERKRERGEKCSLWPRGRGEEEISFKLGLEDQLMFSR